MVGYLGLVFLMGGGARGDILSLVILRPVAIIVCGFALMTLGWKHIRQYRFLFALAAALFVVVGLHLVPLPFSIWASLPGRGIIVEIGQAAQLGEVWRPISMAPNATWNAFFSLFVPFAALLLAVQLNRDEQYQLLPVLIGLGMASGLLGILQVIGAQDGPLYLYRIANQGAAVGLFSNRNHQAILLACLIPMLATYAACGVRTPEQARFRGGIAIAASFVLIPLLLVVGSRAGLILGIVGLATAPLLYRMPSAPQPGARPRRHWPMVTIVLGGVAAITLALVTVVLGRDEAITRILAPAGSEEARFQVWGPIMDLAWTYFPYGSGVGTFVEAYKVGEPDSLLTTAYFNHAHNDWLEVYMTAGAIGACLLALVLILWAARTVRVWRGATPTDLETGLERLASIVILMLGLASMGDYPLRVPSLACLAAIAGVWLSRGEKTGENRAPKQVEV